MVITASSLSPIAGQAPMHRFHQTGKEIWSQAKHVVQMGSLGFVKQFVNQDILEVIILNAIDDCHYQEFFPFGSI